MLNLRADALLPSSREHVCPARPLMLAWLHDVAQPQLSSNLALERLPRGARFRRHRLCFFAFHVPLAIIAPYALLYRTHTGLPAVYQCRLTHWMALVNATKLARLPVIVCTFGVSVLI